MVFAGKSLLLSRRAAPGGKIKASPGFGARLSLQFCGVVQSALGLLPPVQTLVVGMMKKPATMLLLPFIVIANGLFVELTPPVQPVNVAPVLVTAVSVT